MTAFLSTDVFCSSDALQYSRWFMLAVGTLSLILAALGASGEEPWAILVLAGASILLPNEERTAKTGLAMASAVLAVASLVGPLL
jgi:hypothetical protein